MSVTVGSVVENVLGPDLPLRVRAYDGSEVGPPGSAAKIVVRSPNALHRIVTAPGELGLARAYVAGDLDVEGDLRAMLDFREQLAEMHIGLRQVAQFGRLLGLRGLFKHLPVPPEEIRPHGRLHSRRRDSEVIAHHYDVSNDFYRLLLGPTMTYSCAIFADDATPLEQAQCFKYDLICQKLGLNPGMRLLDIGCGWGGMALHAARHYGVSAVGVTLSQAQADLAEKRVADAGFSDFIQIRVQDYRDVDDGPYDAISSIGMFEHVGMRRLSEYFDHITALLVPEGRFLNHAISRPAPTADTHLQRRSFFNRYIFPDGELHEVGSVVSAIQQHGLEVRHSEGLREHYARTLNHWVDNLESNWATAVEQVGETRARIWRLYLAISAVMFEDNMIHVDQVLAVKPTPGGASGFALRPGWEATTQDLARTCAN
jgi:cyclopropane-fatty-acyl-phospholipid synthase